VQVDPGAGASPVRDPITIPGYLGSSGALDRSITGFPEGCAGQNEQDRQDFVKAVGSAGLEALEGV